jgi:hypothetical protein
VLFQDPFKSRVEAARRLHKVIADAAEECRKAGFGPPVPNAITFGPSIKLRALTKREAKQLLRLYPGADPPTTFEGITLWLMGEVPLESRGFVRHDPLIVLCEGGENPTLSSPFRVSHLRQDEEEIVRRHAYTCGFVLMFIATILQGIATLLRQ